MKEILLNKFESISLEEMGNIRLMKRMDQKFVFGSVYLREFLSLLQNDYYVQKTEGRSIFNYDTIYYDTPDYRMYSAHQNGKLNRLKVRLREYVDSNLCFLEIKKKTNKGMTQKERIASLQTNGIQNKDAAVFLSSRTPYDSASLESKLHNRYKRITLVNKKKTERVTIDVDVNFQNLRTGRSVFLPDLVIVEIKKEHASCSSAVNGLNSLRIKPCGLSKYCVGVALTERSLSVKMNHIKSKLIYLHKITQFCYE